MQVGVCISIDGVTREYPSLHAAMIDTKTLYDDLCAHERRSGDSRITLGRRLLQIRNVVAHGSWYDLLRQYGIHVKRATRAMEAARLADAPEKPAISDRQSDLGSAKHPSDPSESQGKTRAYDPDEDPFAPVTARHEVDPDDPDWDDDEDDGREPDESTLEPVEDDDEDHDEIDLSGLTLSDEADEVLDTYDIPHDIPQKRPPGTVGATPGRHESGGGSTAPARAEGSPPAPGAQLTFDDLYALTMRIRVIVDRAAGRGDVDKVRAFDAIAAMLADSARDQEAA